MKHGSQTLSTIYSSHESSLALLCTWMLDFIFLVGLNIPRGNLVFSININVVFVALSLQHTKNEIIFYIREHSSKIVFYVFHCKTSVLWGYWSYEQTMPMCGLLYLARFPNPTHRLYNACHVFCVWLPIFWWKIIWKQTRRVFGPAPLCIAFHTCVICLPSFISKQHTTSVWNLLQFNPMKYQQQCPAKREVWTNLDPTRPNCGHT